MKTYLYPSGTRIRVQRGDFPIDPRLIGQTGFVVKTDDEHPSRYGVILSSEEGIREFSETELEAIAPGASAAEAGETGPGVGS